ncbi:hypothetical protein [Flavivirga sp. 57AJ16]|uniref:DUF7793 family protein n=1 Tax=Flavivirga sp. 57AJ16 TaxID=3025307 RepID=UPI0023660EB3|nr:hypothetical protein [Flavivirga sp. 57AJ16]MDD7886962.1 hypothetical protein [Flavivirga sp. 57AJ16]
MDKIIKIGNAKFWIDRDEIFCCRFKTLDREYRLDSKKAQLYVATIIKLCNEKHMPFIIDLRDSLGTFSTEAANILSKTPELQRLKVFEAYICNSIGMRLLIISYKRIFDPTTPYFIFDDIKTAKEYLLKE